MKIISLNRKGFSTIEVVLAVLILAAVSIVASRFYLNTWVETTQTTLSKKAGNLADMVLEQYSTLAAGDLFNLPSYTNASPGTVFGTGTNNMGYDGLVVTSSISYVSGAANVRVDIAWGAGERTHYSTFYKTLSPVGTGLGGGSLEIWVKANCSNPDKTLCPGLPGFQVRGPAFDTGYRNFLGTNEIIGITDVNGRAILRNVALGVISAKARNAGSAVAVRNGSPGFVQGYYVAGTVNAMDSQALTMTAAGPNKVFFLNFLPLGTVNVRVENHTDNVYDNMGCTVFGYASDGSVTGQNNWFVSVQSFGSYASAIFSNVVPSTQILKACGRSGSRWDVPSTDVYFSYGYTNDDAASVPLTLPAPTNPLVPTSASQTMTIYKLGSLYIETKDETGTNAIGNAQLKFLLPPNPWAASYLMTWQTDANGKLKLYNLFLRNQPLLISANRAPIAGTDLGYSAYNQRVNVQREEQNNVTLRMESGYAVKGTIVKPDLTPYTSPINISVLLYDLRYTLRSVATDAAGFFSWDRGFCPVLPGTYPRTGSIPVYDSVNNLATYEIPVSFKGTGIPGFSRPYSGTVKDRDTGQSITNARILTDVSNVEVGNSVSHPVAQFSDGSGAFNLWLWGTPEFSQFVSLTCYKGASPPYCQHESPIGTPQPIIVDFTRTTGRLKAKLSCYYQSSENPFTLEATASTLAPNIKMVLSSYLISGTVQDTDGMPVKDIEVCDAIDNRNACTRTDAGGSFIGYRAVVSQRTSALSPGKAGVLVFDDREGLIGATRYRFHGAQALLSIPNPADCTTPLTANLIVEKIPTGL